MSKMLRCYAHGRTGDWQAICLDLDIAVQGTSLEEVQRTLNRAIETYIEDAMNEAPADRDRLLNRQAPFFVRLSHAVGFFVSMLKRPANEDEGLAGFRLPCRA